MYDVMSPVLADSAPARPAVRPGSVTVEERRRLTKVATPVDGWGRYAAAEVKVLDMAAGEPLDLPLP